MFESIANLKKIDVHLKMFDFQGDTVLKKQENNLQLSCDGVNFYSEFKACTTKHTGWKNIMHGGVSMTILDELIGWHTMIMRESICVTETIDFKLKAPLFADKIIYGKTNIIEQTAKHSICEAILYNQDNKICVVAVAKMRILSLSHAIRLKISSTENLSNFYTEINKLYNQAIGKS